MVRFGLYYFAYFASFAVLNPYFQLFLAARGFSKSQVGLLLGAFELAGAVGPLILGHIADRMGKRRVMLAVGMACSAIVLVPLNWVSAFWFALPLTAVLGLAYKTTIPLADALAASELVDPLHQYGPVRAMGSVGVVATLWLIRLFGLIDETSSGSILRCFLVTVAIVLPTIFLLPDRHRAVASDVGRRSGEGFDAAFWLCIAAVFLGRLGISAHYSFFSLFLREKLAVQDVSWVWSIGSMAELPVIFFAGRIVRRFGLLAMLIASMAAVSVRLGIYAALPQLPIVAAAQVLHSFTFGLFHTATFEFIHRKVPKARQALAMAVYMSVGVGASGLIGSSLGGLLIDHSGYATFFGIYALAPLLGIVLLLAGKGKINVPPREKKS